MAVGMGGAMLFYQVFVPLLLVATPSSSEEKFGLTGGFIVLQAKPMPKNVSNIIWKHNKDKAAEWFDVDDAPTYYNIFKDVTTLNMQTWALNISNLQPHFSGKYSAEVNNKDPTQFVTLTVLGPVLKPEISMDCIDTKPNCTLTCQGKEDKYTKYTWADGTKEWSESKLTVERKDHDVIYTCNFSNPVDWASSPGTVKKYVPPPSPSPGPGTAIAVVVVVVLLLIAALIIVRLWQVLKRKGKSLTDLWTMSSQDRTDIWRSYISCNNGN
ncbi:SLAM family member 5-like [Clupea harengus]|uniref:SLAM family member 5-like n=1 Tax=Clupea harengus TaxID=7950 RepID=A0A6P8GU58_CLUHA|nr:SLAM family member 5-like [Clupea harengus]